MIRTIFSSFYFLLPIYCSFLYRDLLGLLMFTIGMGVSIANHSHTFHHLLFRRKLFMKIDIYYMYALGIYVSIDSFLYDVFITSFIVLLNAIIFLNLGNDRIEYYTEKEKRIHVLFHLVGISSLTFFRFGKYLIK